MFQRSFYFLRHGETDWNRDKRLQGAMDIPLNEAGRQHAASAAELLDGAPIDIIVSSPLARARETAEVVAKKLGKPLYIDERLSERSFGSFSGLTSDEIPAPILAIVHHEADSADHPGMAQVEDPVLFDTRIREALTDQLDAFAGKNILFVSHSGVFSRVQQMLFGKRDRELSLMREPILFIKDNSEWRVKKPPFGPSASRRQLSP